MRTEREDCLTLAQLLLGRKGADDDFGCVYKYHVS